MPPVAPVAAWPSWSRRLPAAFAVVLTSLALAGHAGGQNGNPAVDTARQLLQRAIHLEEAVGDPEAAIAAYEMAIDAADADAPLAAVAEFRMAVLMSRIGRLDEARRRHLDIATRHANDPRLVELVNLARAALGDEIRLGSGRAMVARRLWEGSEAYAYGALSPDGSFISFIDWTSGNLAIHDLDRGVERSVTDLSEAIDNETWCSSVVSPDGQRIAYTWYSPESGFEVRTVDPDGARTETLLTGWKRPRHVELENWSKDGRYLLAVVYVDEDTHDLALISTEDGKIRTVVELGPTAPELARLSPDGRWIVYHDVDTDGTHDVLLTAADGSLTTRLIDHPANDLLPIWTLDGEHVLFVSDRTGTLGAWVVTVGEDGRRDGEPQLVKPDFGRSIPMGFTDHGALIYAQQVSLNDIYIATLDPETGRLGERVGIGGRFVGVNRSPVLSVDGRRMAYLAERGMLPAGLGPTELVIRDLETGMEHTPSPKLRKLLAPRWHPDGSRLVVEALDKDNRWGIFSVDADRGRVQALALWDRPDCACSAAPTVSRDGRLLAYYRPYRLEGGGDLVVRDLRTREETVYIEELSRGDLRDLHFSPDGDRLAAAVRNRADRSGWRLEMITVDDGTRLRVTDLGSNPDALGVVGWARDGGGVLFVRDAPTGRTLGWAGNDGATLRTIAAPLPADMRETRLHPRYDRLVFTAGEYRAEIWMLENPLAALGSR